MMNAKSRVILSGMFLLLTLLIGGCAKEKYTETRVPEISEVQLPMVFRVEPTTNQSDNDKFVRDFNQQFEGKYQMDVSWLTESTAGYRNKLKQWNVLDELPLIITDAGFDHDFYRILVENDRLVDLRPWMEQSDFWLDAMNPDILADSTEEDGAIYLSPLGSNVHSYAGIIYNEELLKKAGYDEVPQTWDEFFACLDALQEAGITPLALHGSGTYWVPMLFATSKLVSTEEGKEFLSIGFPESYQNDCIKELFRMMKQLFAYTYEDALEIEYEEAAIRFENREAAMIANGKWMFDTIAASSKRGLKFTSFPEGILMNSPRMSAWAVTCGYSEEETEGAIKALEFRIQCEQEEAAEVLNENSEDPLIASYAKAVKEVQTVMPNFQLQWEQEIQNEFFNAYLPEFLQGNISIDEFLTAMDQRVKLIQSKK